MTGIWDPLALPIKQLGFTPLKDLLVAAGCQALVAAGPELPDVPGAFVVLTFYGGTGLELAGTTDRQSMQARCAGLQDLPDSARELAMRVDEALIRRRGPTTLAGLVLVEIARVGGAPTALSIDDARRTHYTCNYAIEVESNG